MKDPSGRIASLSGRHRIASGREHCAVRWVSEWLGSSGSRISVLLKVSRRMICIDAQGLTPEAAPARARRRIVR